jgi:choline-sulfatase
MQPHILLIISDQHRRDWMGCAGSTVVRTPHLDRLAAQGVRCDAAMCASPLCGPSRMALMCGRFPHHLGIYTNEHTLRSDVPTFAHACGIAGYETVLCGRMHFSGIDQRHGFETRLVGDWNAAYAGGDGIVGDDRPQLVSSSFAAARAAGPGHHLIHRFDEAVAAGAERFLATRSDPRPLLLVVGFFEPHHTFSGPPADHDQALAGMTDPLAGPVGHPSIGERWAKHLAELPATEQVRQARAAYAAMIANLDRLIGRVLTAAGGLDGPVQVIYTSDHGEMAGDRGLWGKTVMHEASVGVPFLAAPLDPARPACAIPPGSVSHVPIALTDLAPTIAGLAGAPPMPGVAGRSLVPVWTGEADATWNERPVFSEQCLRWIAGGRKTLDDPATRCVRRGPWKLVYYHPAGRSWTQATTLHHLGDDPQERHDRAGDPACRAIHDALLAEALTGWDPEAVGRHAEALCLDQQYGTAWAQAVGRRALGRLEQFDPERPWRRFGLPGVEVGMA